MKIKISLPKPRNPVAQAARKRHAGIHDKSEKTKRREARQALQKAIKEGREDFSPPFFMCVSIAF